MNSPEKVLKDAVAERHARIEALPFFTALAKGELQLESYVGQLRALATIHKPLIPGINAAQEPVRLRTEQIRLYRVEQPTDLLAVLYVLQCPTLGNTVHAPDVIKTFGGRTGGA